MISNRTAILTATFLAWTAMSGAGAAAPAQDRVSGSVVVDDERTLEAADGTDVEAVFGRLSVPEVRSEPDSRLIDLAFVRLRSRAAKAAPPLVYLAGGPGGSSTWQAEQPRFLANWSAALELGDVILLDQRGTGRSQPDLRYRWNGPPPIEAFADRDLFLEHALEMARRARQAVLDRGIDPRGYTSIESADDIDALRRALGEEKVSLLGFSYGTHLALATLRRHGEHIENAILVGTEGPDHTLKLPLYMDAAFERLSRMVAADEQIGSHIPDLTALLDRVLAKLEAEPMMIPLEVAEGETVQLPIGAFGLRMILRFDIGDASDLPVFPRLLYSIDQGDPSVLSWFVRKRAGGALGTNGMTLLVDGASAASPGRLAMIREQAERSRFGNAANFPFPEVSEIWRPRDVGDEFRSPLVSEVRTLFLSGSLDWNTPPHQAEEVRWGFLDATHLIVENAGHEQVITHPEIQSAMIRFLRGEDVGDVRAAWPPLRFVPLEGYDPEVTHPSVPESRTGGGEAARSNSQ